jgi:hypothetical protein
MKNFVYKHRNLSNRLKQLFGHFPCVIVVGAPGRQEHATDASVSRSNAYIAGSGPGRTKHSARS